MKSTKPCILCRKELESVSPHDDDWENMQPFYGGEVQFIFSYGSAKFDNNPSSTVFKGVICDQCAESHIDLLEEVIYDGWAKAANGRCHPEEVANRFTDKELAEMEVPIDVQEEDDEE